MPRHNNKENIPVMEECHLTEEDRRKIRRKQRELNRDIETQDELEVEEARDRNNEIYKDVRYTREAVLDGENLTLIATKAAQQVERMIQVKFPFFIIQIYFLLISKNLVLQKTTLHNIILPSLVNFCHLSFR